MQRSRTRRYHQILGSMRRYLWDNGFNQTSADLPDTVALASIVANTMPDDTDGQSTMTMGLFGEVPTPMFLDAYFRLQFARVRLAQWRATCSRKERMGWARLCEGFETGDDFQWGQPVAMPEAAADDAEPSAPSLPRVVPEGEGPQEQAPGQPAQQPHRPPRWVAWVDLYDDDAPEDDGWQDYVPPAEAAVQAQPARGEDAAPAPAAPQGQEHLPAAPDPAAGVPMLDDRACQGAVREDFGRLLAMRQGSSHTESFDAGDRGNTFPWNFHSDKAAPHVRRSLPPFPVRTLQGSRKPEQWAEAVGECHPRGDAEYGALGAQLDVMQFLQERDLLDAFEEVNVLPRGAFNDHMCPVGTWLHFTKSAATDFMKAPAPCQHQYGFHATSPYSLWSILKRNMVNCGMAELVRGGKTYRGIFYLLQDAAHGCMDTYGHYVGLRDGWVFAPLLVLAACVDLPADCPGGTHYSVPQGNGHKQYIAKEKYHSVSSMLVHVVSLPQLQALNGDSFTAAESRFSPKLELLPGNMWKATQWKASSLRDIAFWA